MLRFHKIASNKALPLGMAMLLMGCSAAQDAADAQLRNSAKAVTNQVVERNFPGVNAEPITDCIIDNASAREILQVARAAVTGIDDATVSTVTEISKRPETVQCIARNGLSVFGLNGV